MTAPPAASRAILTTRNRIGPDRQHKRKDGSQQGASFLTFKDKHATPHERDKTQIFFMWKISMNSIIYMASFSYLCI